MLFRQTSLYFSQLLSLGALLVLSIANIFELKLKYLPASIHIPGTGKMC